MFFPSLWFLCKCKVELVYMQSCKDLIAICFGDLQHSKAAPVLEKLRLVTGIIFVLYYVPSELYNFVPKTNFFNSCTF